MWEKYWKGNKSPRLRPTGLFVGGWGVEPRRMPHVGNNLFCERNQEIFIYDYVISLVSLIITLHLMCGRDVTCYSAVVGLDVLLEWRRRRELVAEQLVSSAAHETQVDGRVVSEGGRR